MNKIKTALFFLRRCKDSGFTKDGEIAICRRCGNQVIFEEHLVSPGYFGYCPWHDEDLYETETFFYDYESYRKSIKFFAAPLDFVDKFAILKMRLKKG
jgi:hypothetical protein